MKKVMLGSMTALLVGFSGSALAWWGPGWGGPGWNRGGWDDDWLGDMWGDVYFDINFRTNARGLGYGRGWNRFYDYYGPWGYGPYGYGAPYAHPYAPLPANPVVPSK
ncbi:MAG: sulfur globule family protein [Candidatus Thiodiazotropha sp.]